MKTKYEKHGALSVNQKGQLVDYNGEVVQLRGLSTHGLSWYPEYVNREFFEFMKEEWKVDIVRLAMYTDEENGYCIGDDANKEKLKEVIDRGVRAATELGLYVIIDWHILHDSNPLTYMNQSIPFFKEMAEKYHAYGNVFYEICNEPNVDCTWQDVKDYANQVIPVIRAIDDNAVILVGTPIWSQNVDEAMADPLTGYTNLMYVLHFYADTHREELRNKFKAAAEAKLPLFVSEFGICDASGNGAGNEEQAGLWIDLMEQYQVSYIMWNISNRDESSASFVPDCTKLTGFVEADLNDSMKWYVKLLQDKN